METIKPQVFGWLIGWWHWLMILVSLWTQLYSGWSILGTIDRIVWQENWERSGKNCHDSGCFVAYFGWAYYIHSLWLYSFRCVTGWKKHRKTDVDFEGNEPTRTITKQFLILVRLIIRVSQPVSLEILYGIVDGKWWEQNLHNSGATWWISMFEIWLGQYTFNLKALV